VAEYFGAMTEILRKAIAVIEKFILEDR